MVFDVIEEFVDGEAQQGEVLFSSKGSAWIWRENWKCLLLESGLLPSLVAGIGQGLMLRVHLLSFIAASESVIGKTLHSFFQLNVRLGSGQDFTHPSDTMLQ